jgi:segregation and condensation protein A
MGTLLPVRDGGYVVEIERFHGPLDLLLHLIRQQDIDIFDIPIARITDQFLSAVREISAGELDSAGEFLEMAATLIRIKTQMLLPRPESEDDEDPRAELVRRLLEYEQIRDITLRMERSEADRARRRVRGFVPVRSLPPLQDVPLETDWSEVFEAALRIALPDPVKPEHRVTPRTVSMDERAILILARLATLKVGDAVEFGALLAAGEDRSHGVMTLLAGLELTRRRQIRLRQLEPFSDLWLVRREEEPEDGSPEDGSPEDGSPEVGFPEGGDLENGGLEPGSLGNGAVDDTASEEFNEPETRE